MSGIEVLDEIGGGDNTKSLSEIAEIIDNAMIDVIHEIEQGERRYSHWSELKITGVDFYSSGVQIWFNVNDETVEYKVDYENDD